MMRSPARKNRLPQTSETSMVWPKSGCSTKGVMTTPSRPKASTWPGISGRRTLSENSQAAMMTKLGLRNSEGWMVMPASVIQRREPLTSAPMTSVANSIARNTRNSTSERRLSARGDRNEVPISTNSAGIRKITWRFTKWNGSAMPRRAATGGLAASASTMPVTMSAASAPSSRRSTVHHHSPSTVRSAREIMVRNTPAEAGWRIGKRDRRAAWPVR